MDPLTELFRQHHIKKFQEHGPTAKGVDWNDEGEMRFRYDKILRVLDRDFERPADPPSLLDVGCGWGGLLGYCQEKGLAVDYTGIDVVEEAVAYGRAHFPDGRFQVQDVFALEGESQYDYVVCNAILTQRLSATVVEMEQFSNAMIRKMFALSRFGIAFNHMSTRVNFMVPNLYYRSPTELLAYCLSEISPKVRLDHGYSSLKTGKGKFYDFTVYIYKD
jgi:2-polyprenyl-3-methyl-5-hydroxy-6-metoxy-1,4-benzoquinol methylase